MVVMGAGQVGVTDVLGRELACQPVALPGLTPWLYPLTLQVADTQLTTSRAENNWT